MSNLHDAHASARDTSIPRSPALRPLDVLRWIWSAACPLPLVARALLTVIVLAADNASGVTWPLYRAALAARAGVSVRSVARALAALAEHVEVCHTPGATPRSLGASRYALRAGWLAGLRQKDEGLGSGQHSRPHPSPANAGRPAADYAPAASRVSPEATPPPPRTQGPGVVSTARRPQDAAARISASGGSALDLPGEPAGPARGSGESAESAVQPPQGAPLAPPRVVGVAVDLQAEPVREVDDGERGGEGARVHAPKVAPTVGQVLTQHPPPPAILAALTGPLAPLAAVAKELHLPPAAVATLQRAAARLRLQPAAAIAALQELAEKEGARVAAGSRPRPPHVLADMATGYLQSAARSRRDEPTGPRYLDAPDPTPPPPPEVRIAAAREYGAAAEAMLARACGVGAAPPLRKAAPPPGGGGARRGSGRGTRRLDRR